MKDLTSYLICIFFLQFFNSEWSIAVSSLFIASKKKVLFLLRRYFEKFLRGYRKINLAMVPQCCFRCVIPLYVFVSGRPAKSPWRKSQCGDWFSRWPWSAWLWWRHCPRRNKTTAISTISSVRYSMVRRHLHQYPREMATSIASSKMSSEA